MRNNQLNKHLITKKIILVFWGIFVLVTLAAVYPRIFDLISGVGITRQLLVTNITSSRTLIAFWAVCWGVFLICLLSAWFGNQSVVISIKVYFILFGLTLAVGIFGGVLMLVIKEFAIEALERISWGVIGASLIIIAATIQGRWLFSSFFKNTPSNLVERAIFQIALGWGCISYLSMLLAFLGLYQPLYLRMLIIGTLVIGVIQKGIEIRNSGKPITIPRSFKISLNDPSQWIWIGVVFVAGMISLVGAFAPEIEYDALWYHLWLPLQWLKAGRSVDLIEEYISLYPMNWSFIYGAAMIFGNVISAKLIHWFTFVLLSMAVFQFTRKFFPEASPLLAVAFFVCTPTVLWESSTAYNDLGLAFFLFLAVYSLENYFEHESRKWLVISGLMVGLALGIKHLGLFSLLLLSVMLFVRRGFQKNWIKKSLLDLLIFVSISMALGFPYYLRSFFASGNPFFPEMYSIFGAFPAERWSVVTENGLNAFKARFGVGRSIPVLLTLPWWITVRSYRFGGSLGPIFIFLLPWVFPGFKNIKIQSLAGYSIGYMVLWSSPASSFQLRFLVPLVPILCILAAIGFKTLISFAETTVNSRGYRFFSTFIAFVFLLQMPPFSNLSDGREFDEWVTHVIRQVPIGVVTGSESQDFYLSRTVPSYSAWQYINQNTPEDSRILTFSGGDQLYSQRKRIWSDATIARPGTWGALDKNEVILWLRNNHISYVLSDKQIENSNGQYTPVVLRKDFISECLRSEFDSPRFIVYQVTCP